MFFAFFFAINIAFLEISIPIPVDFFKFILINLIIIHPEPVPISRIEIFFPLYIFKILSTNNSVSGLGINVSLFTLNFLLQNSFSS